MEVTVIKGRLILPGRSKGPALVSVKTPRAQTMRRHSKFPVGGERLKRRNGLLHDAPVWAPVEERTRLLFCQI
jgi:hypothetical protein